MAEPPVDRARPERAAPWIVAALAAAAHAGAFWGTFQLDDWNVIVHDPRVQSLGAWARSMPGIRPVLKLTFALNHASGLGLAGFHAVNVLVHAASAALVFLLLRALGRRDAPEGRTWPVPFLAALLFALHPVQTEAVTYVSGRSASLAGALALGSALLFVAGRDGPRRWLATAASPALFLLALGVREQAAALPFALLAIEAADVRRPFRWRDLLRATAGHWLVLGAAAVAFLASPVYRGMAGASLALRPPGANVATHLGALAWLAGQVVRPDRLDADPILPVRAGLDATSLLAGAALVAALGAGLALVRRRPTVALPLLWTVIWLPQSGLLLPRPEPANDRQLYLALVGPAWLLAMGLLGEGAGRRVRGAIAAALLAALAALTAARSRVYVDELRFWSAVLETSPDNPRGWNNLGFALAARCRIAEAEASFQRALALDPGSFRAAMNLRLLRDGEPLEAGGAPCPAPAAGAR